MSVLDWGSCRSLPRGLVRAYRARSVAANLWKVCCALASAALRDMHCFNVSAVLMTGCGRRIGGQIMLRAQFPAIAAKRQACAEG